MRLDGYDAESLFEKYGGLTYDDVNILPGHNVVLSALPTHVPGVV